MEIIKKILRFILTVILVALAAAAILHFATPVNSFEAPYIKINGQNAAFTSSQWHTQTLFGYFSKNTNYVGSEAVHLGTLGSQSVPLEVPEGYDCMISINSGEDHVFSGGAEDYANYRYSQNGDYDMSVQLHKMETDETDRVDFYYRADYSIDLHPIIEFSAGNVIQGDIVTVNVSTGLFNGEPTIETDLGKPVFVPLGDKKYVAYVPIGFAQTPGDYAINVSVGDLSESGKVSVGEKKYGVQNMTIDAGTQASTHSSDANADYRAKIRPTFFTAEETKYWDGQFLRPVEGSVSTEFGLYRYTNGSTTATRHTGVDFAIEEGTPVPASNSGKVVFAGDVIMTGGSIVIDHGGGLKTYYYHLSSVDCKTGDIVTKGDIIGKVGATGYATGPHLHFEVKIGEYSINPWPLFDGTSSIYK